MAKRSFEFTDEDEAEIEEIMQALSVNQGKVTQVAAIRYAVRTCPRAAVAATARPDRTVEYGND